MQPQEEKPADLRIFSKSKIKKYLMTFGSFLGIMGIYTLFAGSMRNLQGIGQDGPGLNQNPPQGNANLAPPGGDSGNIPGMPPSGTPPTGNNMGGPSGGAGMGMGGFDSLWPMWGSINMPSWVSILLGIAIFTIFGLCVYRIFGKESKVTIPLLVGIGIVTIIATNFIQGWQSGIVNPTGDGSQILTDAVQITNILEFIRSFEALQPNLSVHAQTQPPGAIIAIFILYILFQNAGIMSIALCVISGIGSAYFLNGIFNQFFDDETRKYGILLYLVLPAVQVYYLANIYAIVAMFAFGTIYFYLKIPTTTSFIATFVCLLCLTFLSYLSVWIFLFFGLYELIHAWRTDKLNWKTFRQEKIGSTLKAVFQVYGRLALFVIGIIGVYIGLYMTLGYNYLNSFMYASALENPNGFMLTADPLNYLVTRLEDILDIAFFFGPVLMVLCWEGFQVIRNENKVSKAFTPQNRENISDSGAVASTDHTRTVFSPVIVQQTIPNASIMANSVEKGHKVDKFDFIMSGLGALLLLFLTGAPKKGETARICLFILPFLLIPVLYFLTKAQISRKEKVILLLVVVGQAILMQIFANYIW